MVQPLHPNVLTAAAAEADTAGQLSQPRPHRRRQLEAAGGQRLAAVGKLLVADWWSTTGSRFEDVPDVMTPGSLMS